MANSIGDMVVRIVGDNQGLDKAIDSSESKMQKFGDNMSKIGKKLSLFVSAPLALLGRSIIKSTANMEMLESSFETMLGSAEAAKKQIADLTEFAAKTPFELNGLAQATQTLLQFGVEADQIMPTIKSIGDVSQGNAQRMQSIALAFGQIRSSGRLMGQDLLQLINSGFNPLQVISKQTGKSVGELKKEMEKGSISAEQVAEAFKIATSEGGQFFNGMERASQTFSGKLSTLKDDASALGRQFGEILLPIAKEWIEKGSQLVKQMSEMDIETKKFILTVGGIALAAGPVAKGISGIVNVVQGLGKAFAFLAAKPVVLGIAGIAAAVGATHLALKAIGDQNIERELGKVADRLKAGADSGKDLTANIMDVAKATGLSVSKVAELANGAGLVSDELRAQVDALVAANAATDKDKQNYKEILKINAQIESSLVQQSNFGNFSADNMYRLADSSGVALDRIIQIGISSGNVNAQFKAGLIGLQKQRAELNNFLLIRTSITEEEKKNLDSIKKTNDEQIAYNAKINAIAAEKRKSLNEEYTQKIKDLALVDKLADIEEQRKKAISNANAAYVRTGEEIKLINEYFDRLRDAEIKIREEEKKRTEEAERARKQEMSDLHTRHYAQLQLLEGISNAETESLESLMEKKRKSDEEEKENLQERSTLYITHYNELLRLEGISTAATTSLEDLRKEYHAKEIARIKERLGLSKEAIKEEINQTQDLIGTITEVYNTQTDAKITALEKEWSKTEDKYDDELDAIYELYDKGSITQEEYYAQKAALQAAQEAAEAEYEKKKIALQREEAKREKALSVFNIIVNTAQAVAKALPNLILAAIAAASGAAQLAIVKAQPLPELADGGIARSTPGGQVVRVAEAGEDEVIAPLSKLKDLLATIPSSYGSGGSDGGMIHLQVTMDSKPFLDTIFPATRNKKVLISAKAVV